MPHLDDDDGAPGEKAAGIDDEMKRWLELGLYADSDEDFGGDDDASRGLAKRVPRDDAGWYLDAAALGAYLGAAPITVDCASALAEASDVSSPIFAAFFFYARRLARDARRRARRYGFVSANGTFADVARALAAPAPLRVARFGGGFNLGSLRGAVTRDEERAVETGPFRRFAPRLHAIAAAFRRKHLGDAYAVVHWRSETLVARRDGKALAAFDACAREALAALPADAPALLVTDMPHDPALPLWTSFRAKLARGAPGMAARVADFLAAAATRGAVKYDAAEAFGALDRFDLGDAAIVEQILAVEADVLITHRAEWAKDDVANWTGVSFDVCGYAGRFMRTMVTRRLDAGRPVRNWLTGDLSQHETVHGSRVRPRDHVPVGED